ncbi:MAG: stalk domain-containing protein [Caldisericia bacterium]|nr:stalk domain-containing protein [Caldisericia bacterium]
MRNQKRFVVVLMVGFLSLIPLLSIDQTTKAQDDNPLKIEKVIGLSTIPGTFRMPTGIAVAKDGTIFIADSGESQIEVFDANLNFMYHFGSIGSGDSQFQIIEQIHLDENDNLYVLDSYLSQIKVFKKDGSFIKKWGDPSQFDSPHDFVFLNNKEIAIINSDHIYTDNAYIKVFSLDGDFIRDFIQDPEFLNPNYNEDFFNIAVDLKGYVYLHKFGEKLKVDYLKFSPEGYFVCEFLQEEDLKECAYLEYKAFSGQFMYVNNGNAVYKYKVPDDPAEPLQFVEIFLNEIEHDKDKPCRLGIYGLLCSQDKLYTFDFDHTRVTIYNLEKQRVGFLQSPIYEFASCYGDEALPTNIFSYPKGLTIGPDHNLYVVNRHYNKASVLNQEGEEIHSINLPFKQSKQCASAILLPEDIVFDQQGYCYMSDIRDSSIHVFKPDLTPHMVLEIPDGNPEGLAVNSSGNLVVCVEYYSDFMASKILLYDISKIDSKEITIKKTILLQNYLFSIYGNIVIDDKDNMIVNVAWWIQYEKDKLVGMHHSYKLLWINPDGEIFKEYEFDYLLKGVSRDGAGNIYTIQQGNSIVKLTSDGEFIWQQDMGHSGLYNMAFDSNGKIYVTDSYHNAVLFITDITLDKTPHALKISPIPKEIYDPKLHVQGETEPEATVTVNQQSIIVKPDGTFKVEIIFQKGENTITVIATDKARNSSEFSQVVTLKEKIVIHLFIGQSIIIVNGKNSPIDSEPYIDKNSGRTMVPVRVIIETVAGGQILYDSVEKRIDLFNNDTHIIFWIGNPKAIVYGKEVDIDPDKPVSPVIYKSRSYLPLRFIAETFEFKVDWEASTQRITLTYPKE